MLYSEAMTFPCSHIIFYSWETPIMPMRLNPIPWRRWMMLGGIWIARCGCDQVHPRFAASGLQVHSQLQSWSRSLQCHLLPYLLQCKFQNTLLSKISPMMSSLCEHKTNWSSFSTTLEAYLCLDKLKSDSSPLPFKQSRESYFYMTLVWFASSLSKIRSYHTCTRQAYLTSSSPTTTTIVCCKT